MELLSIYHFRDPSDWDPKNIEVLRILKTLGFLTITRILLAQRILKIRGILLILGILEIPKILRTPWILMISRNFITPRTLTIRK